MSVLELSQYAAPLVYLPVPSFVPNHLITIASGKNGSHKVSVLLAWLPFSIVLALVYSLSMSQLEILYVSIKYIAGILIGITLNL